MNFKGQHILSTNQFDKDSMSALFAEAREMEKVLDAGGSELLSGKIMATIFFEPSTRTRFSFETAMLRLGGKVVSNPDMMKNSSVTKMETLQDTARAISKIVDVIVARHPEPGSVRMLAEGSEVPVLNGGDGSAEHPSQGLLDLYTMWKEFGALDGLTIGMVGDLKNSRVLHSQCDLLKHYDVKFILVSPRELALPAEMKEGLDLVESEDLAAVVGQMDVLSQNRLQKERFDKPEDCEKFRGLFRVDAELMKNAKEKMIILNPLPRVDELATELDADPRARYFDQVRNGVALRMALLKWVLTA